jgi:hypothetical protein
MRQKKIVNILIVIAASALLLFLWFRGLNQVYGHTLVFGTNIFLSPFQDIYLEMDTETDDPVFIVHSVIEGRTGRYPQDAKLILLPFIMILTWQILMFFNLDTKYAVRSALENLLIFYLLQVIFLIFLTQYYNSGFIKFIYNLLSDSFYIIALFLIIKDTVRYRILKIRK